MGFSSQEYWSGQSFPPPGDLPEPHLLPLLHWQVGSLPLVSPGKPEKGKEGWTCLENELGIRNKYWCSLLWILLEWKYSLRNHRCKIKGKCYSEFTQLTRAVFYSFIGCQWMLLWRRQWHPTPVLLPGKSHGPRRLVGCSPRGREESDTTERLHFHSLEKEMATHSSVLAWRIPGMGEPGGLPVCGVVQSRTRLKRLSSSNECCLDSTFSGK